MCVCMYVSMYVYMYVRMCACLLCMYFNLGMFNTREERESDRKREKESVRARA